MSHGTDKRLSSYAWQKLRLRILRRDGRRCQWRLAGCTDYANAVDHIIPRVWLEQDDLRYWAEDNLAASCAHCNRKRPNLKPGEYGSYGTAPRVASLAAFVVRPPGSSPRLSTLIMDFSRKGQVDAERS